LHSKPPSLIIKNRNAWIVFPGSRLAIGCGGR